MAIYYQISAYDYFYTYKITNISLCKTLQKFQTSTTLLVSPHQTKYELRPSSRLHFPMESLGQAASADSIIQPRVNLGRQSPLDLADQKLPPFLVADGPIRSITLWDQFRDVKSTVKESVITHQRRARKKIKGFFEARSSIQAWPDKLLCLRIMKFKRPLTVGAC